MADAIGGVYKDGYGKVKAVGFADKVKIAAMKALGFDRPDEELIALADQFKIDAAIAVMYREPGEDDGPYHAHDLTGRENLQYVGTEVGRELFGEDFWIDQVLPDPAVIAANHGFAGADLHKAADVALRNRFPDVDVLCITDLRFENEALRVLSLGGQVWEVTGRAEYSGEHASEHPLPRAVVSQYIDNSGDLMYLEGQVEQALNLLSIG